MRWADDFVETITTTATAWTTPVVLVRVDDPHPITRRFWIPDRDVARLEPRQH